MGTLLPFDLDAFAHNPAIKGFSAGRRWKILELMALSCKYFEPGVIEFLDADIRIALGLSLPQWYVLRDLMELKGMLRQVSPPDSTPYYELAPWLFPGASSALQHPSDASNGSGGVRPVGRPRKWADDNEKNAYYKARQIAASKGLPEPTPEEFVQQRRLERTQECTGCEITPQNLQNFASEAETKPAPQNAEFSSIGLELNSHFAPREGVVVVASSTSSETEIQQQTTQPAHENFASPEMSKFFSPPKENIASTEPEPAPRRKHNDSGALRAIHALSEEVRARIERFCEESGFSLTRMDRLIAGVGIEVCEQQIEWYPARVKESKPDFPCSMLHTAITENWPAPDSYVESAKRKRDRDLEQAKRRAGTAHKEAERAAVIAFRATVQEALASCSAEQREHIEVRALALVDSFNRGKVEALRRDRKELGPVSGAAWNAGLEKAIVEAFPDLFPGRARVPVEAQGGH